MHSFLFASLRNVTIFKNVNKFSPGFFLLNIFDYFLKMSTRAASFKRKEQVKNGSLDVNLN